MKAAQYQVQSAVDPGRAVGFAAGQKIRFHSLENNNPVDGVRNGLYRIFKVQNIGGISELRAVIRHGQNFETFFPGGQRVFVNGAVGMGACQCMTVEVGD